MSTITKKKSSDVNLTQEQVVERLLVQSYPSQDWLLLLEAYQGVLSPEEVEAIRQRWRTAIVEESKPRSLFEDKKFRSKLGPLAHSTKSIRFQ